MFTGDSIATATMRVMTEKLYGRGLERPEPVGESSRLKRMARGKRVGRCAACGQWLRAEDLYVRYRRELWHADRCNR